MNHYKIPLEPQKIEDWEYGNPVTLERDYSKRIDDKELKQKEIDDTAKAIEDTESLYQFEIQEPTVNLK